MREPRIELRFLGHLNSCFWALGVVAGAEREDGKGGLPSSTSILVTFIIVNEVYIY